MTQEQKFGFLRFDYEWRLKGQSPPAFLFSRNQIVQKVEPLKVTKINFWKQTLWVPKNVAAVVRKGSGEIRVYSGGLHTIKLALGNYELYFVDTSWRSNVLENVIASSLDNLQVKMNLRIIWEIIRPQDVIFLHNPIDGFLAVCTTIAQEFIRSHKHDDLVPMLRNTDYTIPKLCEELTSCMTDERIPDGFKVLYAHLTRIVPDTDRRRAIQEANRRITELEQEIYSKQQLAEKDQELLRSELDLGDLREALEIIKNRIARRTGSDDFSQLTVGTLREEVEKSSVPQRLQPDFLERLMELPRYRQEQLLKLMELMKESDTGSRRVVSDNAWEALFRQIDNLTQDVESIEEQTVLASGLGEGEQISLAGLLGREMSTANTLEQVLKSEMNIKSLDQIDVSFQLQNYTLIVECDNTYQQSGPRRLRVYKGVSEVASITEINWIRGSTLKDAVSYVQKQIGTGNINTLGTS
jgi:hypothetical protein